jgi:hypothetical protein
MEMFKELKTDKDRMLRTDAFTREPFQERLNDDLTT